MYLRIKMPYKRVVTFLTLIINFQIISSYKNNLDDVSALAKNIWKLYKLSSIVIIVDDINLKDLNFQMQLIVEIRKYSLNGISSHGISYDGIQSLKRNSNSTSNEVLNNEILFVLYIYNEQSLEYFRLLWKDWNMWIFTWMVIVENVISLDCGRPRGNLFNLELDTTMIVKCDNSSSIKKYYSIFKNITEVTELGIWTPERKLIISNNAELILEKINLKRLMLTQVGLINPISNFNKDWVQFFMEFMKVLESIGNFTTKIVIERNIKGIFNITSKQWMGVVSVLAKKEVDMSATLLSISKSRMQVIDFTIPIKNLKNKFYLKLSNSVSIQWHAYFKVFNGYSWVTIASIILTSSILLTLTKRKKINIDSNSFFEMFINVWCIFCQQGFLDKPFYKSTQILYVTMMFLSLILNSIYSASITSYLTVLTIDLPFNSYIDFLKDNSYKIITLRGTKENDDIVLDDSLLIPLRPRLKDYLNLPINPLDGLEQVCDGDVAFYTHELNFNAVTEGTSCAVGSLSVPRITQMSLGLSKNSPYTKLMNYYILLIQNNGIMNRMGNKYFYQYDPAFKTDANLISILEIIPILSIWACGLIMCFGILILEIFYYRLNIRIEKQRLSWNKIKRRLTWHSFIMNR